MTTTNVTTTLGFIKAQKSMAATAWGRSYAAAEEYKAAATKLNEEARENWDNDAWHRQVAMDLANTLDYGFTFENLFGAYIQVVNKGEFDAPEMIRERKGLKVYYTARGGYVEESQLTSQVWELPRDRMGFHVSESIDKLRANFAETIADLTSLGQARLEAEVNRRILSTVQAAVPSGHASYVATTGLAKTELDAAIRQVRDAVKPDGTGPIPVTVIGRAAMIDGIAEFVPTFSPVVNEEVRQQGFIGHYKGAQVIVLHNYTDEDGKPYLPSNELYVMGGTAGRFAFYGGLNVKTWDENAVDYRHYRATKELGGLIHHPEQIRRVVDSSQSATS